MTPAAAAPGISDSFSGYAVVLLSLGCFVAGGAAGVGFAHWYWRRQPAVESAEALLGSQQQ